MRDYIKEKKNFTWRGVRIIQKDNFISSEEISMKRVLKNIESLVPNHLTRGLDSIYVGEFDFLDSRDLQATYLKQTIFVTNKQENEKDIANDIVHEVAHFVEENNKELIYTDNRLKKEFLTKRALLRKKLIQKELPIIDHSFQDPDYNQEFDEYLYQDLGYELLASVSFDLFYSPYGATSLREYFANGFEGFYYYRESEKIKKISPILFEKLEKLYYNRDKEINWDY